MAHAQKPLAHHTCRTATKGSPPNGAVHPQANQTSKKTTTETEMTADRKDKYIPLDMTDTYRMFKDRAQIETAILLKVYHSPIYVP